MVVLQSAAMKILFFSLCSGFLLHVQTKDTDRHALCESCLIVAKEFEKIMGEPQGKSIEALIDDLLSTGKVCTRLQSYKHFTKEQLTSSCLQLIDSHYEEFHTALMSHEPQRLDVVLCYEKSTACVGVKRHSFEDSTGKFTDSHIDTLLRDNEDNVRFAQPVHPGSPVTAKDEL